MCVKRTATFTCCNTSVEVIQVTGTDAYLDVVIR